MTSIEPPLAVIAASADFENLAAFTVNFFVNKLFGPLRIFAMRSG